MKLKLFLKKITIYFLPSQIKEIIKIAYNEIIIGKISSTPDSEKINNVFIDAISNYLEKITELIKKFDINSQEALFGNNFSPLFIGTNLSSENRKILIDYTSITSSEQRKSLIDFISKKRKVTGETTQSFFSNQSSVLNEPSKKDLLDTITKIGIAILSYAISGEIIQNKDKIDQLYLNLSLISKGFNIPQLPEKHFPKIFGNMFSLLMTACNLNQLQLVPLNNQFLEIQNFYKIAPVEKEITFENSSSINQSNNKEEILRENAQNIMKIFSNIDQLNHFPIHEELNKTNFHQLIEKYSNDLPEKKYAIKKFEENYGNLSKFCQSFFKILLLLESKNTEQAFNQWLKDSVGSVEENKHSINFLLS